MSLNVRSSVVSLKLPQLRNRKMSLYPEANKAVKGGFALCVLNCIHSHLQFTTHMATRARDLLLFCINVLKHLAFVYLLAFTVWHPCCASHA